uniref:Uncharacterized protein n=1 Tax=Meloidogyne enterolobii TaxID=390850 RepID=A0A6V7UAK7_MELEN|nr:unnamed protein product [Meloidogyne enterolobii]
MFQYSVEDNLRIKRATFAERRLARQLAKMILRALFSDETIEKLDKIIFYLAVGLNYLFFIAWPIADRISTITCDFPEFDWLRNHWPFGGGHGQNNGGGNNQFNQQIHPQEHPQVHPQIHQPEHPPVHQPPQQIPWLQPYHHQQQQHPQPIHPHMPIQPQVPWFNHQQHQQQQQAISYTDNNYPNISSSSSNLQQNQSFNRQHSINNPQRYSDNESMGYDVQQDIDDEESDNGGEPSQVTDYSDLDRKRRSASLMGQNNEEKEENGGIQENNSYKTQIINPDSKNQLSKKCLKN